MAGLSCQPDQIVLISITLSSVSSKQSYALSNCAVVVPFERRWRRTIPESGLANTWADICPNDLESRRCHPATNDVEEWASEFPRIRPSRLESHEYTYTHTSVAAHNFTQGGVDYCCGQTGQCQQQATVRVGRRRREMQSANPCSCSMCLRTAIPPVERRICELPPEAIPVARPSKRWPRSLWRRIIRRPVEVRHFWRHWAWAAWPLKTAQCLCGLLRDGTTALTLLTAVWWNRQNVRKHEFLKRDESADQFHSQSWPFFEWRADLNSATSFWRSEMIFIRVQCMASSIFKEHVPRILWKCRFCPFNFYVNLVRHTDSLYRVTIFKCSKYTWASTTRRPKRTKTLRYIVKCRAYVFVKRSEHHCAVICLSM